MHRVSSLLASAFAIALFVGCSSTALVTPTVSPSPTVIPAGGGTVPLFGSSQASGYTGSLTPPAATTGGGATLTVTTSTTLPSGLPAVLSIGRRPLTDTAIFYFSLSVSSTVTWATAPGFTIVLPSTPQTGGSYYLAFYDPAHAGLGFQLMAIGPATVNGSTLTFAPTNTGITLTGGLTYWFALYFSSTNATPTPMPTSLVYVANRAGQVLGFTDVNGNNAPVIDITGNNTQLSNPVGFTIDASGSLYVENDSGSSILIFPHGANGNVAPSSLGGSNSVIGPSEGVALDHSGLIYVSAFSTSNAYNSQVNITVFAAGSTGNATPVRRIAGAATLLTQPTGMAFDSSNDIWVGNYGGALLEFAASANGNVAPIASVSGANTGFSNPFSVAVDSNNRVIVGNYDGNSVSIFAANPSGNATPVAVISGTNTGLQQVGTVGVDALNNIYVTDFAANSISVFPSTANGNVFPTLVIGGASTLLNDAWYPRIF